MANMDAVAVRGASPMLAGASHSTMPVTKKDHIVYWVTTGIIALLMLGGAAAHLFSPEMKVAFHQLGFPDYFRFELATAKILGAIALIAPRIPRRVREWAYAGIGIVLISAFVAHFNTGDPLWRAAEPLGFLVILAVSNVYWHRLAR